MSDLRTVSAERWLPAERQHVAACNTLEHLYETGAQPVICDYITVEHFPAALVDEMRGWLSDCEWRDLTPEDCYELDGSTALRAVERYFEGGLAAFAEAVS